MNTRRITLDLDKTPCETPVVFRRTDHGGVTLIASITDAGEAVSLSSATVKLVAMCSAGNVEIPCVVSGNIATTTFGESDISESCIAYLRIVVGDRKYSTARFRIKEV